LLDFIDREFDLALAGKHPKHVFDPSLGASGANDAFAFRNQFEFDLVSGLLAKMLQHVFSERDLGSCRYRQKSPCKPASFLADRRGRLNPRA